jgi:hypothetical protein
VISTNEIDWKEVFYYDVTSPSCLRWACNIENKGTFGNTIVYVKVIGDKAGTLNKGQNRWKVKYQQKLYMVHRIIYELFYGPIPEGLVVDHIDGDASNNHITNLRAVTPSINCRNARRSKHNNTGVKGVALSVVIDKKYGGVYRYYTAMCTIDGKTFTENFPIHKLGEQEAFRLACEYRAKMIEELNSQGAGYTERHGT